MPLFRNLLKFNFLLLLCCTFAAPSLFAQTLNGRVIEATNKSAVVAAYITNLRADTHTHTDENGRFQFLKAAVGDSLEVSYLGFESQIVVVESFSENLVIRLEEATFDLSEVVVRRGLNSLNVIADIDLRINPINSAQEILRKVPGLIIGQHAGGGKAEQIFLRGFDIDHGTDISINVDGVPVNMVSHAHGQGYADLHFIIPEAIEGVDFGKGTYYAEQGNFATAGYIDFSLKDRLNGSLLSTEVGQFNTYRTVAMMDLVNTERNSAYIGTEFILTDGPFESSQHFSRLNVMGKFTTQLNNMDELSIWASHFQSKWDASGQIPVRAVEQGLISRFGAIDDTEGGFTDRTNIALTHKKIIDGSSFFVTNASYSSYNFELFSNFTFFLEDPDNGDQIRQYESRQIFNVSTEWNKAFALDATEGLLKTGIGLRYDNVDDNELSRTLNRQTTLERIQFGDVDETNLYAYADVQFEFGDLTINPGFRLDAFTFSYADNLSTLYDRRSTQKAVAGPKLNFFYNAGDKTQLFVKSGIGFHSNDSRVVLNQEAKEILPLAYGLDVGGLFQPFPRLFVNTALWYLFLEQEFVYVGDAGIVEPSGESRRSGVDFGARYQVNKWLFANFDINYTMARSVADPEGENFIPLAPALTSAGGLSILAGKLSGGVRYRYVEDRPANEDNSIIAEGYFIVDANLNYRIGNITIGASVENLFDQEWNETQFATESRLRNETNPVEEIHFTPGTPFFLRGKVSLQF